MRLSKREFRRLVLEALERLPEPLRARLDNCDIVVEDWPSHDQLAAQGLTDRHDLLGLYEGVPLTERASYNLALPDKVTLFQRPIEAICQTREEVVRQVELTVSHEVAHHFGISDAWLEEQEL